MLRTASALRRLIAPHERQRLQSPFGGEHGVGARKLQKTHRNAVPIGQRRLLDRPPILVSAQAPAHFTGKVELRRCAEACTGKNFPQRFARQSQSHFRGADVR
jgi:hypothetical protein